MASNEDLPGVEESDPIIQVDDLEQLPRSVNIETDSNTHSDDEAKTQDNFNEYAPHNEIHQKMRKLQRDILYMYKTPYQKYKERGQKPYNMIAQIFKMIFVTIQASDERF